MKLFHGTSTALLADISASGLIDPYLTDNEDTALYYAECAVDENDGEPVILIVDADETYLRYDGAAMDEPVMADTNTRNNQWKIASTIHPEWIKNGFLIIPEEEFIYSLRGVSSVRYEGKISEFDIY